MTYFLQGNGELEITVGNVSDCPGLIAFVFCHAGAPDFLRVDDSQLKLGWKYYDSHLA